MHAITSLIVKLVEGLPDLDGDKPATHAQAKALVNLAQGLVKATQPGVGEFKWTAKARKELTRTIGKESSLMVARGDGPFDVWHTNGYYAVRGEPSQRFDPCEYQDLPFAQVMSKIKEYDEGAEPVEIVGASDRVPGVDCVELSNGTVVNRLLLAYVTATVGGVVRLYNKGPLYAVCVRDGGETMGIVMPINVK
jgi:hypothetical protein